ncbi:MAG: D-Ala-D-Ala carboxypeptidase family metallohydrolase [Aureispira sp.]
MPISNDLIQRLEELKTNIETFLRLHKNPYDSSVHNELAAKLERVELMLKNLNTTGDNDTDDSCSHTDTGGDTSGMGGDDTSSDTVDDGSGMGGDDTSSDTVDDGSGMGGDDTSSDTVDDGSGTDEEDTSDNSTDTSNLARTISASVGDGGTNNEEDVRTVQGWLNSHGASLEVNGQSDTSLINEIKKFQRRLGNSRPDGKVDPGYDTFKGLIGEKPVGPPSTGVSSIIQGGESGAAGYNAYNRGTVGNTTRGPNGPRVLIEMTLATIMTNQKRAKDHADYLFAVGKYQLIPDTLALGVTALNLDTSLKYNESTQELLFSGYLMDKKRPQISAYIKGESGSTAQKAGLAAAKEWASIACPPNTTRKGIDVSGKSYYDGIGGNTAHITHEDFVATLDEAKVEYQKYLGQGMSDADAYKAAVSGVEDTANSGGDSTSNETDTSTDTGDGMGGGTDTSTDTGDGMGGGTDTSTDTGDGMGDGTDETGTDDTAGDNTTDSISGSVGRGGDNTEADVKIVQELLNGKGGELTVDGKIGNKTIGSIESFQSSLGQSNPDGLVEPGKNTWKGLIGSGGSVDSSVVSTGGSGSSSGSGSASAGFDPGEPLESGSRPSTSNFSLEEFAVSGSRPDLVTLPPQDKWSTVQKVFNNLEVIRTAAEGSITINSGYRNPNLNSAVGGASSSKHMLCQAADITCSTKSPAQLHAIILRLMQEGKITPGGLSEYSTFVHYDIRGSYVTW